LFDVLLFLIFFTFCSYHFFAFATFTMCCQNVQWCYMNATYWLVETIGDEDQALGEHGAWIYQHTKKKYVASSFRFSHLFSFTFCLRCTILWGRSFNIFHLYFVAHHLTSSSSFQFLSCVLFVFFFSFIAKQQQFQKSIRGSWMWSEIGKIFGSFSWKI
jgi:hypothetical protein